MRDGWDWISQILRSQVQKVKLLQILKQTLASTKQAEWKKIEYLAKPTCNFLEAHQKQYVSYVAFSESAFSEKKKTNDKPHLIAKCLPHWYIAHHTK